MARPPQIVGVFGPDDWRDCYPEAETASDVVETMTCEHGLASLALVAELGQIDELYLMTDDTVGVRLTINGQEFFFWRGERTGWDDADGLLDAVALAVFWRGLADEEEVASA